MLKADLAGRPTWRAPKLEELGNLRTLVRVGQANGKSGREMDGGSNAGCESMDGPRNC